MRVTSKACLLIISLQLLTIVSAQEVVKRVPQGFVGMRGKKYYNTDGVEHFYKRKPQFFVGVKGKKSLDQYLEQDYKRAPMGFVGMRGKKEYGQPGYQTYNYNPEYVDYVPKRDSLIGQIDYSPSENILKEQTEFPLLNQLLKNYLYETKGNENSIENSVYQISSNSESNQTEVDSNSEQTNDDITNEVDKRSKMHQFFGVRGKKSIQAKRPFDVSFRGKFIGVRGKKDLKNSYMKEIKFLLDNTGPLPKRKAQMNGFFGMRGKKWADDSSLEMEYPSDGCKEDPE